MSDELHGEQIRAARALLGWTATELAQKAELSYPTVQRMDATVGIVTGHYQKVQQLRRTLEAAGIQFLERSQLSLGRGVSLRKA